jgi:hypothetical protein
MKLVNIISTIQFNCVACKNVLNDMEDNLSQEVGDLN